VEIAEIMTVLAMSHIAIGVTDMERALPFYRDVLGLRVDADWRQQLGEDEGRELHKGRAIDRRCVWLRWGDGPNQSAINLDELLAPQARDRRADIYDLGVHHVSLWVVDVDGIVERAKAIGCDVIMPHISPTEPYGEPAGGRIQSVFLKDPDGNLIQCDRRL
jgi:catechol 2,3-dioxygenase-like lactoylglutathione lyase family enzyme